MAIKHVLLVEDAELDRVLLQSWLVRCLPGLKVTPVGSLKAAQGTLNAGDVDAILLDLGLPDSYGLPTLKIMSEMAPETAIVVLSSQADRDMLELARIDMGHAGLVLEQTSVADLVHSVCDTAAQAAVPRAIVIAENFSQGMPPMLMDRAKVVAVLNNLLSNAIKYSPDNTSITVSAAPAQLPNASMCLELRVTDQGFGVQSGDYRSIFEPFVRGEHKNANIPGTGLGLAIVKEYVELHGGTVWAEPNAEQGTLFCVRLPWVTQSDVAALRVWEGIYLARRNQDYLSVVCLRPLGPTPVEAATLEKIAKSVLPSVLRRGDHVAFRPQKNDIILIVAEASRQDLPKLLDKMTAALGPFCNGAPERAFEIGLAVYPDEGSTPQELLGLAMQSSVYPPKTV